MPFSLVQLCNIGDKKHENNKSLSSLKNMHVVYNRFYNSHSRAYGGKKRKRISITERSSVTKMHASKMTGLYCRLFSSAYIFTRISFSPLPSCRGGAFSGHFVVRGVGIFGRGSKN